ncbi:hypothetical protein QR98_0091050 [Sarcoptes scabiei]|uniref:Uncharacterized protein n=1 Tax=Sarcoptes scabiei TaxID=52283 RepID=A0A132AHZ8_SARSC|nr:hypothetical protein QR98_0091050 [Sarcoptes scabiei]
MYGSLTNQWIKDGDAEFLAPSKMLRLSMMVVVVVVVVVRPS